MSLSSMFGWSQQSGPQELPDLFPLGIAEKEFVTVDVISVFSKILTDVIERTQGLADQYQPSLWDNCVQSENSDGLITLLAKAMAGKKDLFLVYDSAVKLLRLATNAEEITIRADYAAKGESSVGAFISFKNYSRSDMVRLYSALEYCAIAGLNKSMNLGKALQFKINDLRGSVSLVDSEAAKTQAGTMARALSRGKDIVLDAKDLVETLKPDVKAVAEGIAFLDAKRSFYLGMPASYITGELAKGLGDSGQGDAKAIDRGLKNYFFSIIKPVLEAVFGAKTTFKSEDFEQILSSLEALKIFELTSDELIGHDNKNLIINKLFGLPEDEVGDPPEKIDPMAVPGAPGAPPPANGKPPPVPPR